VKVKSKIFFWYVLFVAGFVLLTLIPTPDQATLTKYHLSALSLRLLDITLIIPEVVMWYAAFYGYLRLQQYGQLITGSAESKHIKRLALGLLFLAAGLPLMAIISGLLSLIAKHHASFTANAVIINNYLSLISPLLAFLYINVAARGLSDLAKRRPRLRFTNLVILTLITLGVVFCCLITANHHQLRLTYHLSPQLVMLSLGIPYMYIWFLGLQACAELYEYSRKLTGIVYRKGWNLVIIGLVSIIFLSIAIQYLTAVSSWLLSLGLGSILLLLYALLLLLGGAYIVVALGANKLTRIEEA
jgi:hypothetical protein